MAPAVAAFRDHLRAIQSVGPVMGGGSPALFPLEPRRRTDTDRVHVRIDTYFSGALCSQGHTLALSLDFAATNIV